MTPLDPTTLPPLQFEGVENTKKFRAPGSTIGWIRSIADAPGAKFDLTIKDALGRVKYRGILGGETDQAGVLARVPTLMGEELEVSIDNLQNAKKVSLFLN